MLLRSFRAHFQNHITAYLAIALNCYFLAQTSKQLHNAIYVFILLPTLLLLNKSLIVSLLDSTVFKVLLAFGAWHLLSISWSTTPDFDNAKDVLYVVLFVIAIAVAWQKRKEIHKDSLVLSSLITCLPSLYLLVTTDHSTRLYAHGIFSNPLTAANSLIFLILANVYLVGIEKRKNVMLFYLLAAALHLYLLLLCQSRGSLAALFLGMGVLLYFRFSQLRQLKTLIVCLLLSISLLLTYAVHMNWLAIPHGNKQSLTYHFPNQQNIHTIRVYPTTSGNPDQEIISLQSGSVITNKHEIQLDPQTQRITVTLSHPTLKPYSQFRMFAVDKNGNREKLRISPPRILNFESSFGNRLDIWIGFYDLFQQAPIIGHGASQQLTVKTDSRDAPYSDPHNVLVGTAINTGSIGLFLHLLLLFATLKELLKESQGRPLFLSLFASGMITTMLDDPHFFHSPLPYWLLLLIPIGYAVSRQSLSKDRSTDLSAV